MDITNNKPGDLILKIFTADQVFQDFIIPAGETIEIPAGLEAAFTHEVYRQATCCALTHLPTFE